MGAGKTVLTKGICRGIGYKGEVTSPSYIRIHKYNHSFPIYHVDFYLLRSEDEVMDLGLDELYLTGSIVIIEWAQRFPEMLPVNCTWIDISWQKGENNRLIQVRNDHPSSIND